MSVEVLWRSGQSGSAFEPDSALTPDDFLDFCTLYQYDVIRINPRRFSRGYLLPGEPLYVRMPVTWQRIEDEVRTDEAEDAELELPR